MGAPVYKSFGFLSLISNYKGKGGLGAFIKQKQAPKKTTIKLGEKFPLLWPLPKRTQPVEMHLLSFHMQLTPQAVKSIVQLFTSFASSHLSEQYSHFVCVG